MILVLVRSVKSILFQVRPLVRGKDWNCLSLWSSFAIHWVIRFPIFWDVPTGFVSHPPSVKRQGASGARYHSTLHNPPFMTSLLITMETFPESQRLDCGIIASGRRRGRGEERRGLKLPAGMKFQRNSLDQQGCRIFLFAPLNLWRV